MLTHCLRVANTCISLIRVYSDCLNNVKVVSLCYKSGKTSNINSHVATDCVLNTMKQWVK